MAVAEKCNPVISIRRQVLAKEIKRFLMIPK
jgi:hypothetical protein